ncbi:MAG: maleylacetoacetate isomerase [Proteobacteria bacterium]|nr:maleylacetoacetate isomerase [Pseudomonadota bacterium]
MTTRLYTFWRSSAAYRVRIALALKGIAHEQVPTHLGRDEQRGAQYLDRNPQGLVPALDEDGFVLGESMAIIEYLDETHPAPPLLPADARGRAIVRSMAQSIACDIHPLNNLRVLNYLKGPLGQDQDGVNRWYRHWIAAGFEGLEMLAQRYSADGAHLYGDRVTLADVLLVPQLYNARRFQCDLSGFPALTAIGDGLARLPAFAAAAPEVQPDAE